MKEKIILDHYRCLIENNLFDEYDILGFLIFIREKIDKSFCHSIYEFSNMIAHRDRDQGNIYQAITNAIRNKYEVNSKGKVKGYHGVDMDVWKSEWHKLGKDFNIKISKQTLKEITVCICSLAQDTTYSNSSGKIGKIELFIDGDNYFTLCTSEGKSNSVMVCFFKGYKFTMLSEPEFGCFFDYPVETKREGKLLKLYYKNKVVFEVQ